MMKFRCHIIAFYLFSFLWGDLCSASFENFARQVNSAKFRHKVRKELGLYNLHEDLIIDEKKTDSKIHHRDRVPAIVTETPEDRSPDDDHDVVVEDRSPNDVEKSISSELQVSLFGKKSVVDEAPPAPVEDEPQNRAFAEVLSIGESVSRSGNTRREQRALDRRSILDVSDETISKHSIVVSKIIGSRKGEQTPPVPSLNFGYLHGLHLSPSLRGMKWRGQELGNVFSYRLSTTYADMSSLSSVNRWSGKGWTSKHLLSFQRIEKQWSVECEVPVLHYQGDVYLFDAIGRSYIRQGDLGRGLGDVVCAIKMHDVINHPLNLGLIAQLPTGDSDRLLGMGRGSYGLDVIYRRGQWRSQFAWIRQGDYDVSLGELDLEDHISLQLLFTSAIEHDSDWRWSMSLFLGQNPWRDILSEGGGGDDMLMRLGFACRGAFRQVRLQPELSLGLNSSSSFVSFGLGVITP